MLMKSTKDTNREKIDILIVEDSITQSEQLKHLLEQEGYRVTVAGDGKEALSHLASHKPTLVISDIVMPVMNGYELCKHIKSNETTWEIPVILLTSLISSEDVLEGLSCGADNFITKPYNEEYLLSIIAKILASGRLRKTERVRMGVEVLIGGKRRFITADQQQMLSLLLSTYEAAVQRNTELTQVQDELRSLNERLEDLVQERTSELLKEIAERKRGEARVGGLNAILRAVRSVNQLITREKDRKTMIDEACFILVSSRGFNSAWIALVDETGKLLTMTGNVQNEKYMKMAEAIKRDEWPFCTEKAMEESGIVVIEAGSTVCRDCLLSDDCRGHGAFVARIRQDEKNYGFMVVSLPVHIVADQEEQQLFKEAVSDIAFALYNIELEERRFKIEKELKDSEARYRALFEGVAEGILMTDMQTKKFKYANPAMCQILGYSATELNVMTASDIHPEDALEKLMAELEAALEESTSLIQHNIPFLKKDGTIIFADVVTSPGISIVGRSHTATFVTDITERHRAEEEKKRMEIQLLQSQKMEAIGRLSGGIAHDFNNILTTIIGNSEMTLAGIGKEDPLWEPLEDIKLAGEKAAMLTRQLLAFSRRQILQAEKFNLNEIVTEMDKMLRRLIGEDIELETMLSPDLGIIEADPGQVEQIIMNLAINSRDAMPNGGKLTIETASVELDEVYAATHFPVIPGSYEMVSVSDTGIGISKENKEQIFEPFFTTKPKGKGTGLGLSIVYGIVKQSNGYIWVYSEPGKGAAFKIYFPRVEDDDYPGETARKTTTELCGGSETVMVVEDDRMIMKVIKKVLVSCGYSVLFAADGNEALRVSEDHNAPIHLLLTDVIMPGMGGRELMNRLGRKRPDMKVLFMSGYTDNAIVHHGVLEKGLSFIQKPFASGSLKKKVREVLDKD
jgi:two-component system, cell cycle sensor histidine kinase and response regulator CckA